MGKHSLYAKASSPTPGEPELDYDEDERDMTCEYCAGTGGDPWNDGIVPCPKCDGEGYRWWE